MWKKRLEANSAETNGAEEGYTFLAKGVAIEGIAQLEGVVRIDGHFNGGINANDILIIGEHAVIRGSISADEIICSGNIQANLTAKKRVKLLNPAVLVGDITTPSFSMEEGVFFQGRCDMGMSGTVEYLTKELPVRRKVQDCREQGELVPTP